MQKNFWGPRKALWSLLILTYSSGFLLSATESGFRYRLGFYARNIVNNSDSSIKELSKRYEVPIVFESGAGDGKPDSDGIFVRFRSDNGLVANVEVGEAVQARGLFSVEDGKKLAHVVNAYISEALSDASIFAGIQFLQNSFESKIQGESPSSGWERQALTFLVAAFLILGVVVFLMEGKGQSNREAFARHLF